MSPCAGRCRLGAVCDLLAVIRGSVVIYRLMLPLTRLATIIASVTLLSTTASGFTVLDEEVTLDISDADETVSFWIKGQDQGNSQVEIVGEEGRRFRTYLGIYRLRFPTAVPGFVGYARYPSDMWTGPEDWHRVTVDFSTGTVRAYRMGYGTQEYTGSLTRENGTLDPQSMRLWTSGPEETMRFRATMNASRRVVAPRFRPLLAVTAANVSFTVSEQPVPGATNIGHESPIAIPAEDWLESREPTNPVQLPDDRTGALRAAVQAIEQGRSVSFRKGERIDPEPRENTSHIVLVDTDHAAAALLPGHAPVREARIAPADTGSPAEARWDLRQAVHAVTGDMSLDQRTRPMSLTLLGVPWFREQDPIEDSMLTGSDPVDGKLYPTDAPYFDIDEDGWAELAYGRLPTDPSALRNVLGADLPRNATVLAAYRTEDWVSTVRHNGAGMVSGHQLMWDLRAQGKDVRLVVENRTGLRDFRGASLAAVSLLSGVPDPESAEGFLDAVLEGAVGNGSAKAAIKYSDKLAKAVIVARAGDDPDQLTGALSSYSNVVGALKSLRDVALLFNAVLEYRFDPELPSLRSIADPALDRDWDQLSVVVLDAILEHRPVLNTTSVERALAGQGMTIYSGRGNGTHWVLPNRDGGLDLSGFIEDGDLFNQYNGTNAVRPGEVQGPVIDLSGSSRGRHGLARTALRAGASGYLGFSARPYPPFPGLYASEYVLGGLSRGEAFRSAFNSQDSLVALLNPANLAFETGIFGSLRQQYRKTHRSMFQFMPPTRSGDPPVRSGPGRAVDCGAEGCTHTRWYNASQLRQRTRRVRAGNGTVSYWKIAFDALEPSNISVRLRTGEPVPDAAFATPDHTVEVRDRVQGGGVVEVVGTADTREGRVTGAWINYTTPTRFRLLRAGNERVRVEADGIDRYGVVARNRTHRRWLGEAPVDGQVSLEGLPPGRWELTAVASMDAGVVRDRLVVRIQDRYPRWEVPMLRSLPLARPLPEWAGPDLAGDGAVPLAPGDRVVRLRNGSMVRLVVTEGMDQEGYRYREDPVPTLRVSARGLTAQVTQDGRSSRIRELGEEYVLTWNRSGIRERYRTPSQVIELRGRPRVQDTISQRRDLAMEAIRQLGVLYRGRYPVDGRTEVNNE